MSSEPNAPRAKLGWQRWGLQSLGWVPVSWYLFFLVVPLGLIIASSLATRGTYGGIDWALTFENFARSFDPLYVKVLLRSVALAFTTTVLCFVFGFPTALTMSTSGARTRNVLIMLMAIPFLTNLIIRICAIRVLTALGGPLDTVLTWLHIAHDPFALSQNLPLVLIGMVLTYLPFMVFPIFAALERFDFAMVDAAQDLGATYAQIIWQVILPNLRKALAAAALLVFIPACGDFVIPDLLGGAKTMLAGNLISEQFLHSRDWPFGSALAVILMIVLAVMAALIQSAGNRGVTHGVR